MAVALVLKHSNKFNVLSKVYQNVVASSRVNFTRGFANSFLKATTLQSSLLVKQFGAKRMMSSDHARMWKLEKILTVIMIPVIPATFLNPGTEVLDNLFAVLVMTHAHFGLEAIAKDYVRPIIVGPVIPKIAVVLVYAITATTLGSLLYFNHHNVGIGAAGQKIWSIGRTKKEA